MIARLDILQIEPQLYEYFVSIGQEPLFNAAGYTSISQAIAEASSQACAPIMGLEIAYGGIVAGTYHLNEISYQPNEIAEHVVSTYSKFL